MSAAAWAERYIERLGLALVPLPPASKAPPHVGWNLDENLIRTARAARAHWSARPNANMGACLEPSRLVSLDCDDFEASKAVLSAEGIDVEALIATTPTICGRAPRLEFRAPDRPLERKVVKWPPRPSSDERHVTVLELRAGRFQDVLPPSIHPDTRKPYRWLTPPHADGFPPLPDSLLRLWLDFDAFRLRARNLCPWAEPEPEPLAPSRANDRPRAGPSVIAAFNEAHDAVAILKAHGYKPRGNGKRFASPNGKNAPGVVLLPDGKVYAHDWDDVLADGRAHDAFDLYRLLEHRGDQRAAVKGAARILGLDSRIAQE